MGEKRKLINQQIFIEQQKNLLSCQLAEIPRYINTGPSKVKHKYEPEKILGVF